jgi:uncharacterized protein
MKLIEVRDLAGHPGESRFAAVAEPVEGLKLGLAAVPEDVPVTGDLRLQGVEEGVFVTGGVSGPMRLVCARCLKEFDDSFDVNVNDLYATNPGDDDYALSEDKQLDPEPMIRDAVALSMPFSPLHDPGCKGLCERCGGDRNLNECTCTDEVIDPRWSALSQLIEQEQEQEERSNT